MTFTVVLAALAIHAADLWFDHQDRRHQVDVQAAHNAPEAVSGSRGAALHPSDAPGLQALEDSLRTPPEDVAKPVPGARKIPAQPLLDLVQSLLSLGRLSKETASDIRSQITQEMIKDTGEIAVDTAKKIIARFFEPSKSPVAPTSPVAITLTGCCCGARRPLKPPPPPNTRHEPACPPVRVPSE